MVYDKIYWLNSNKECIVELPNGFNYIGDVQSTAKNRMTLPSKNLELHLLWE